MKNYCRLLLLLFFGMFFCASSVLAQDKDEKKSLKKARRFLTVGKYEMAKKEYDKLLKMNGEISEYWFETGLAYYNSGVNREQSISYFEKAKEFKSQKPNGEVLENDTIGEVFYYLGRAYQYVGRWDDAITEYNNFKDFVKGNKQGGVLSRDVDQYIEMCNNGKRYQATINPDVTVTNLGKTVNTIYPEYAPVINKDETIVIFTARRESNTGKKYYHDNRKYEDIYVSAKQDDDWIVASKIDSTNKYISSKINSKYHDAAIAYSYDEKKLYIYRQNDVWQSDLKDGKWTEPKRLNNNVNTAGHEPSVFINPEGNALFVVSNRKGGFGGRDIYMSERQDDGNWGEVVNLGANVNTAYDEDAPFLTVDGRSLYFSSNNPKSVGGYDIFKSEFGADGAWKKSENVGMPINTPGDDIYYVENEEGTIAYYASSQAYGFGDMDIYRIGLECKNIPNTEVRGLLVNEADRQPIGGRILVTDNETGEEVGEFTADAETGKYLLVLPPGRSYHFKVEAGSYLPHNADIEIPKQCEYYQLYQEVHVKYLTDTALRMLYPQKATFHNAFYDVKREVEEDLRLADLDKSTNTPANTDVDIISFVKHNGELGADEVDVYLLNADNEIIKKVRSSEDGVVKFTNVDPSQKYSILIDQESLQSSDGNQNGNALGDVFYERMGGEPVRDMSVFLGDKDKQVVAVRTTDENGHWMVDGSAGDQAKINEVNKTRPFDQNIEIKDVDNLYSSYITRADSNENNRYAEVEDVIDIEMIADYIRNNPDRFPDEPDIRFENILFDFDRYFLRDRSKETMDKIVAYLKENPDKDLTIEGHTDWFGSDEYNMALSKKRAEAATNYLKRRGIDTDRLKMNYYGESRPTAANANPDGSDNEDGRQQNRRCEFKITSRNDVGTAGPSE